MKIIRLFEPNDEVRLVLENKSNILYIVTESGYISLKDGAEGKVISHFHDGNVCVKFKNIDKHIYVPENLLEVIE